MSLLSWVAVATAMTSPRTGTPMPVPTATMVCALVSRSPVSLNVSAASTAEVTVMSPGLPGAPGFDVLSDLPVGQTDREPAGEADKGRVAEHLHARAAGGAG